ncbi:MAG: hypothetical protein J07HX64_00944 [halophilic archaeon J07HX64]|nr:MAG: hypothetical protein J07HX64_00944 [halophilic archaeon J07HX64]
MRLPSAALVGLRAELEERFVVTVREDGGKVHSISSPTMNHASAFLARSGLTLDRVCGPRRTKGNS